jgi:PmbA protein
MARASEPSDLCAPLPSGPFQYDKHLLNYGDKDIRPERLSEYVGMAVQGGLEAGASRVAGTLTHTYEKKRLVTSAGVNVTSETGGLEVSVRAFTDVDATGHFVSVSSEEGVFKPYEAGYKAGEIAVMARNPVKAEPGVYEALLGPMTFAHLVEQLGIFSSAFYVDAGISFLSGRLSQTVASEKLTILDDPTIRQSVGATAFDDEGVRTQRNMIVEKGVLKGYLHNSGTARKFGTVTTANAGLIVPHPFNLYVQSGGKTLEELISAIDKGIWVTNDWYLRYQNYRSGEFSTIPRDGLFLIRKGSIEKPLKELRISDNILEIFRNINDVGRDCYWVRWWEVEIPTYTPAVSVERLRFTSSAL